MLSTKAKMIGMVCSAALVACLGYLLQKPAKDLLGSAAQPLAWLTAMLLIPVFTYEHHLLFAWPAMALVVIASLTGRLSVGASIAGGLSVAVLMMDLGPLRKLYKFAGEPWLIQEMKWLALVGVTALVLSLGATREEGESDVR